MLTVGETTRETAYAPVASSLGPRLARNLERHGHYVAALSAALSAAVVEATRRAGYRGAVTTIEALNAAGQDRYALRRIGVHDNMTLPHFIVIVSGLHAFMVRLVAAVRRLAPRALRVWPRPAMPLPPTDAQAR